MDKVIFVTIDNKRVVKRRIKFNCTLNYCEELKEHMINIYKNGIFVNDSSSELKEFVYFPGHRISSIRTFNVPKTEQDWEDAGIFKTYANG